MLLSDIMFEISGIAPGFWGWGQLTGYGILATITLIGFTLKTGMPFISQDIPLVLPSCFISCRIWLFS